jgi:Flp pilus assembly protein TadD
VGDFEASERTFLSALEREHDKYALIGLSKLYCLKGKVAAALTWYERLLGKEGEDLRYFIELGDLLVQTGRKKEAAAFYRGALALQGNNPQACRLIESLLEKLGH